VIGTRWSAAGSSGTGFDFTAHQTTQQRYAMGIFRMTMRKISSHTMRGVYPRLRNVKRVRPLRGLTLVQLTKTAEYAVK
jgi:hypothetical protein